MSADSAMEISLFLLLSQVRGLIFPLGAGGQGQDRTVDLPLFRRSVPDRTAGSFKIVSPALPA
jgi:hypothetical protein